jgi:hypothetical protein
MIKSEATLWLIRQRAYLPHSEKDPSGTFKYGTRAAFEGLAKAGIIFMEEQHPDHPSLMRVALPPDARLVSCEENINWALVEKANKPIAYVSCALTAQEVEYWYIISPDSPHSPARTKQDRRRGGGSRRSGTDVGDAIEDGFDALIDFFRFW